MNNLRLLTLVAKGQQILVDIIVESFKILKNISLEGVMHPKGKLKTYTIQIKLEKEGFVREKKNKNFQAFPMVA